MPLGALPVAEFRVLRNPTVCNGNSSQKHQLLSRATYSLQLIVHSRLLTLLNVLLHACCSAYLWVLTAETAKAGDETELGVCQEPERGACQEPEQGACPETEQEACQETEQGACQTRSTCP